MSLKNCAYWKALRSDILKGTQKLSKLTSQFTEKSPIKYALTLHLSSFSPSQIISISEGLLVKIFKKLLEALFTIHDSLLISDKVADHAKV